jgi:TonB family protein
MKSIHEFLADEGVLQNGISRSTYQQMILNETMGIQVNELTNHFNVSLLKKRIAMMTKTKSKIWARSKVLFALPILLVMGFILTANSNGNLPAINPGAVIISQAMIVPAPDPTTQDKPKQETQVKYVAPVVSSNKADQEVDKMPAYPGGDEARSKFFVETVKYPENALKKGIQGTVFISFLVKADGSITNVKIMRGIGGGCDEEAIRVVKLMPKWTPGELKGKPVDVEFTMPIKFALDGDKKDAPKK